MPYCTPTSVKTHTVLLTARLCLQITLGTPQSSHQPPLVIPCPITMSHHPHSRRNQWWPLLTEPSHHHPSPLALHSMKQTNNTPQCHQKQPPTYSTMHGPPMAPTTNPYPPKKLKTYSLNKRTSATPSMPQPMALSPLSIVTLTSLPSSFMRPSNESWHSKTL